MFSRFRIHLFVYIFLLSACQTDIKSPKFSLLHIVGSSEQHHNLKIFNKSGYFYARKNQFSYVSKLDYAKKITDIANLFEKAINTCQQKTGLTFLHHPMLRLVVTNIPHTQLFLKTTKNDYLELPIVGSLLPENNFEKAVIIFNKTEQLGTLIHEWTETELVFRKESSDKISFRMSTNNTRWLNEGVSEYCAHLAATEALHTVSEQNKQKNILNAFKAGQSVFRWSQSSDKYYYPAAFYIVNKLAEKNVLAPLLTSIKNETMVDGETIANSLKKLNVSLNSLLPSSYKYIQATFQLSQIDIDKNDDILFQCKNSNLCGTYSGKLINIDGNQFHSPGAIESYFQSLDADTSIKCLVKLANGLEKEFLLPLMYVRSPKRLPAWL